MAEAISGVNGLNSMPIGPRSVPQQGSQATGGVSFQDLLVKSVEEVHQLDSDAQAAIETGLVGGHLTEVEIFTSVKKADLALRTMLQIRNKLVDAYHEVQQMRM